MMHAIHTTLGAAVLRLLKPLVTILLRHGMAYGTFAELARKAYVDAAFEEDSLHSKRPNISSVSALTGLTRKATKRLLEWDVTDNNDAAQRYSCATRPLVVPILFTDQERETMTLSTRFTLALAMTFFSTATLAEYANCLPDPTDATVNGNVLAAWGCENVPTTAKGNVLVYARGELARDIGLT